MTVHAKFDRLGTESAPGQEARQQSDDVLGLLKGSRLEGTAVDFSHGDVDAHEPTPVSFDLFSKGVSDGGRQAYTEYRGDVGIREEVGRKLATFTNATVEAKDGLIVTPGTQGALFLAVAATVSRGDKVVIAQPDYFANRKLVEFFEGEIVWVGLDYHATSDAAGLDLSRLEDAFKAGAKVFLFSNPNNPTGIVYSKDEIRQIAALATRYRVNVIVDELYSRLAYSGTSYSHLRAEDIDSENVITILGPSKTESLSGYRLGVAFGSSSIIARMEKLQAIVSLRAAGYSQAVLKCWFSEPEGWLEDRIRQHEAIRDDLISTFRAVDGVQVRSAQAGSYLFPRLPKLSISPAQFVKILRLQANVVVTPGAEFGPHSSESIRLNFSQDHKAAAAAALRVAELVERYRE